MLDLNLQLFAEDDEDIFLNDDLEDIQETEEELPLDEVEEDVDLEEDEYEPTDKKTKAIIKQKKENKELKRQLLELQETVQANELAKETSDRILELTRTGKSTTEATKIATDEKEVKKLRLQLSKYEIGTLENKYPGISLFAKQLAEDKAKLPEFSYEQLYMAKYSKATAFDEKTKIEQELLFKTKEARSKSLDASNTKTDKTTRLSADDEKVYQYLKQSRPKLTRKQFLSLSESTTLEI